jgi:hypothetical protein
MSVIGIVNKQTEHKTELRGISENLKKIGSVPPTLSLSLPAWRSVTGFGFPEGTVHGPSELQK